MVNEQEEMYEKCVVCCAGLEREEEPKVRRCPDCWRLDRKLVNKPQSLHIPIPNREWGWGTDI